MLAYFLAILVAITSLVLYLNAFIRPKIHRKDDFLWSGLGLFYALVLWVCAGRMTGGVLLGQVAGVAVAIAFVWENIQLRSTITAQAESNQVLEGFSVLSFIVQSLTKLSQLGKKKAVSTPLRETKTENKETKVETTETQENKEEVKSPVDVKEEIEEVKEKIEAIEEKVEESVKDKSIDDDKQEEIVDNSKDNQLEDISENQVSVATEKEEEKEITTEEELERDILDDITEENKPKVNLLGRIRNIFRKNPEKPPINDELPESLLDEIEDMEEEIDPETTAVEVEEAIANLDITDTNQEENKETSETNATPVDKEEKEEVITNEESTPDEEEETDNPVEATAEVTEEKTEENQIEEEVEVIVEITDEGNEEMEMEKEVIDNNSDIEVNDSIEPPIETASTAEEKKTPEIDLNKEEEKTIPPEDTIASLDELTVERSQESEVRSQEN